jgi:hypothetical protein
MYLFERFGQWVLLVHGKFGGDTESPDPGIASNTMAMRC